MRNFFFVVAVASLVAGSPIYLAKRQDSSNAVEVGTDATERDSKDTIAEDSSDEVPVVAQIRGDQNQEEVINEAENNQEVPDNDVDNEEEVQEANEEVALDDTNDDQLDRDAAKEEFGEEQVAQAQQDVEQTEQDLQAAQDALANAAAADQEAARAEVDAAQERFNAAKDKLASAEALLKAETENAQLTELSEQRIADALEDFETADDALTALVEGEDPPQADEAEEEVVVADANDDIQQEEVVNVAAADDAADDSADDSAEVEVAASQDQVAET